MQLFNIQLIDHLFSSLLGMQVPMMSIYVQDRIQDMHGSTIKCQGQ